MGHTAIFNSESLGKTNHSKAQFFIHDKQTKNYDMDKKYFRLLCMDVLVTPIVITTSTLYNVDSRVATKP